MNFAYTLLRKAPLYKNSAKKAKTNDTLILNLQMKTFAYEE